MTTEAGANLKPAGEAATGDFEPEQKRYLEGFAAGVQIARTAKGLVVPAGLAGALGAPEPVGPDAAALKAQDRVLKAGGKLSDPEKFKREQHPFDAYERLKEYAAKNEYPKPPDNFRWRFFGLFYVAPNQNSFMCRLRMPNGILKAAQFAGVADLAERYGGGYAHVTTRANLQIREIEAKNAVNMIEAVQDLGLCSRGSGADNIRNVTGGPTAGIDRQELIDTRPYTREWHFHILNDRSLYGLPRKFNVGFDGAGIIPVLEDTNDIGFQAVQVNEGFGLEPGVWFRLCLGGLTGHQSFAGDTGVRGQARRRHQGGRRGGARVHRYRRPHRPHQGAAQIRARQDGRREIPRPDGGEARPQARPRRARRAGAAPGLRPHRAYRHSSAETGRTALDRRRRAGRPHDGRADEGAGRNRARSGRRRYPAHGLAELADFGRAVRQIEGGAGEDRSARSGDRNQRDPRRPGRLHRQYRLQVRRLRHQAARRGDRALVRDARRARHAGQYSSHRLPSFLRAAFRQRDRPARLQGQTSARMPTRSRAIIC